MVRTGQRFGAEHVIGVLLGTATPRMTELGHDRLPTFGVGTEHSAAQWRSILRQLTAAGHILPDIAGFGGLGLTESGWSVLRGHTAFEMREDIAVSTVSKKRKAKTAAASAEISVNQGLLDALKEKRRELAAGLPLYAVFSNRTLVDMADRVPASIAEMRQIHGVGDVKLLRYGAAFLDVITAWRARSS
jgi:ATP-dependent DNA helicase RecQ